MANTATETPVRSLREVLRGAFASVGRGLVAYTEILSRSDELQRLSALSDEQLAKMGLRRDQIVHHVFRDRMHF